MHPSVMKWVADEVDALKLNDPTYRVLEVGSLNVNGSPRDFFPDVADYVGVDIRPGPGVDIVVEPGEPYRVRDGLFDVVISTEMLEHDARPWVTVAEMRRVLRSGGWLLLTARGYDERGCFPVHDYPADHWRYSLTGMTELLKAAGFDEGVIVVFPDPEEPGVVAKALK